MVNVDTLKVGDIKYTYSVVRIGVAVEILEIKSNECRVRSGDQEGWLSHGRLFDTEEEANNYL